jgi:hypothetical protein
MDKFISHVVTGLQAPGLEVLSSNGTYEVMNRASLQVKLTDFPYSRNLSMKQVMTHLGKVSSIVQGGASTMDGINKVYLDIEGKINWRMLSSTLKNICGVQTAVYSAHLANAEVAPWGDNQTALLVNCLRYVVFAACVEANGAEGKRGSLGFYDDGHVSSNRDAMWGIDYPEAQNEPMTWPGGNESDNYPIYAHEVQTLPAAFDNIISLRGMDTESSRFILAMCGRWIRTSRYSVDFSTDMLTPVIRYRREQPVDMISWIEPEEGTRAVIPPVLSAKRALTALRRYVHANRLYSNFSDAIGLVSDCWQQFVPDTCEGQAWLQMRREVVLPKFEASRARYQILVEGEGALMSPRALDEYGYLGDKLERLNLYASLKAQAAYTGLYSRAVRRQNEEMPLDILSTEGYIVTPDLQWPAAISEAVRIGAPLQGPSGGYVYMCGLNDGSFSDPVEIKVDKAEVEGYNIIKKGRDNVITVEVLPPPGVPLMLLPLPLFGNSGPWALNGTLQFDTTRKDRIGVKTTLDDAYAYAWVARLCGQDVAVRNVETVNATRFFASNDASFTYNLQQTEDGRLDDVKVWGKTFREHSFITLPNIHTKESDAKIDYKLVMLTTEVRRTGIRQAYRLCEYGGSAAPSGAISTEINVPAGIKRLQGYLMREPSDFRVVETPIAAVIPEVVGGLDANLDE